AWRERRLGGEAGRADNSTRTDHRRNRIRQNAANDVDGALKIAGRVSGLASQGDTGSAYATRRPGAAPVSFAERRQSEGWIAVREGRHQRAAREWISAVIRHCHLQSGGPGCWHAEAACQRRKERNQLGRSAAHGQACLWRARGRTGAQHQGYVYNAHGAIAEAQRDGALPDSGTKTGNLWLDGEVR